MRPLKAYLSKSALLHNVAFLQQKAPNSQLCTVLKANAYGHRVALMVPILEHVVNFFAVAAIEEAETIRTLSNTPIILLEGVFEHHEYHLCDEFNFIPAIGNAHQLNGLSYQTIVQIKVRRAPRRVSALPSSFVPGRFNILG